MTIHALDITESFGSSSVSELTGRRYKVRLIEGNRLGSSGYYPAEVLLRDGPKVFTKGTPMFVNHQTAEEKANRPFGDVQNFAGELAEDAYYENDGLYAEIEVFEDVAPMIKASKDRIGISIRAKAIAEDQVINGKLTPVVKQITEARSADFVMRPGAGGKIVSILESAVEEESEKALEESGEIMDQAQIDSIVDAIAGKFESRLASIEESLKAVPVVEVKEEANEIDPDAKALEIAEAFVNSTLDAEGRKRVLALHKASGDDISKLIEAEEAYVKTHSGKSAEVEGIEESAVEVEESAKTKVAVPTISAWK